jgi:hypothetical protein
MGLAKFCDYSYGGNFLELFVTPVKNLSLQLKFLTWFPIMRIVCSSTREYNSKSEIFFFAPGYRPGNTNFTALIISSICYLLAGTNILTLIPCSNTSQNKCIVTLRTWQRNPVKEGYILNTSSLAPFRYLSSLLDRIL